MGSSLLGELIGRAFVSMCTGRVAFSVRTTEAQHIYFNRAAGRKNFGTTARGPHTRRGGALRLRPYGYDLRDGVIASNQSSCRGSFWNRLFAFVAAGRVWRRCWCAAADADVPGDAAARRDCSERSGGVAAMGRRANAAGRPSPARRCRRRTHGPRNQCCMPHRARTLDVSEQGQRLHRPATHAFGPSSAGWAARPGGAGQCSACCLPEGTRVLG